MGPRFEFGLVSRTVCHDATSPAKAARPSAVEASNVQSLRIAVLASDRESAIAANLTIVL